MRNAGGLGAPVSTAAQNDLTDRRSLNVHGRLTAHARPGPPLRFVSGLDC
jgi:hypothetical protein